MNLTEALSFTIIVLIGTVFILAQIWLKILFDKNEQNKEVKIDGVGKNKRKYSET